MNCYKLTEKELLVLDYFIENESKMFENGGDDKHFYSYPARLEREINGEISRVHAKEVCEKYEEMGIFAFELKRPPRQRSDTKYFHINPGFETFGKIVQIFLENFDLKVIIDKMSQGYFQNNISEELLEYVFTERKVFFPRYLDICNWETSEAKNLLETYLHTNVFNISPPQLSKKLKMDATVDERMAALPDFDIQSFELYMKRKLERMDLKNEPISQFYPIRIKINFPYIENFEKGIKVHVEILARLNQEQFEQYPTLINLLSAFEDHYRRWQEENLTLPLLSLLKASPSALGKFLNGEWELGKNKICEEKLSGSFSPVMDKLIFLALGDLASSETFPINDFIESTHIRSEVQQLDRTEKDELLSFNLKDSKVIYFDRCFGIGRSLNGDNVEKSFVSFYDQGISYSWDVLNRLNEVEDGITNFSALVIFLKDANGSVCKLLYRHFSYELKNYLKYCDPSKVPSKLETHLKLELKHALVHEEWFELLYGDFEEFSKPVQEKLKNDFKMIQSFQRSSSSDIIIFTIRIDIANYILKDVMPSAFGLDS